MYTTVKYYWEYISAATDSEPNPFSTQLGLKTKHHYGLQISICQPNGW